MISIRDLTLVQRTIFGVGAAVVAAALVVLAIASDLNLAPLRTLTSTHTDGSGTVIATHYNAVAFLGLGLIAFAAIGILALGVTGMARLIPDLAATGPSAAIVRAGRNLEQELARVLGLIRAHIATNDSYAKSLANAQARLSGLSEAEQVRVIVSLLVAENERMRRDSEQLKLSLEDSHSQILTLRSSLNHVQQVVLKDPLTGTGNRRQFDATMGRAIQESDERSQPLSLIMCDIDHFKRVNDAFGHQIGDELIKMFARVIEQNLREADTVIRYGGEEFAIILPMTDQTVAISIAERIRLQFESKRLTIRETSQKIGQLTASFGVAEYRSGDTGEDLVQRADAKLYDAKSRGRNRVASFGDGD
ncbi:GGDEF domain-containing protein [Hyphomicrobium sp. CS1GBMeth3]|uniref:GGDEF domain-containing protein n=1 Tax=Hyphomicrobium sp. CS1GBMeth3 TaxID=1892845 RepID=UPI0009F82C39|nr:GGDEF domain-containing protein [Hyphomicrobium sp. CS1GBMeth3]